MATGRNTRKCFKIAQNEVRKCYYLLHDFPGLSPLNPSVVFPV
jgi:hypothetical protein